MKSLYYKETMIPSYLYLKSYSNWFIRNNDYANRAICISDYTFVNRDVTLKLPNHSINLLNMIRKWFNLKYIILVYILISKYRKFYLFEDYPANGKSSFILY